MELIKRPRRLRGSANLRKMVRETRMDKSSLIYPLFVMEGNGIQEEIPSMEGQFEKGFLQDVPHNFGKLILRKKHPACHRCMETGCFL